jgi:hypothetical protein
VNRLEAIRAGLSKNYPMYWTGPRYQVPDADLRDLLALADSMMDCMEGCDCMECPSRKALEPLLREEMES